MKAPPIRLFILLAIFAGVCVFALPRYQKIIEQKKVEKAVTEQKTPDAAPVALPVRGGEKLDIQIQVPYFSQKDPRWANDELGKSGGTLGGYGCTLCSATMSLHAFGIDADPKALNQHFTETGGYTESGWLIWEALRKYAGNDFEMVVKPSATHAYLDQQLKNQTPVIAKVLWQGQIWHWVLITGKKGDQYLIA
ncbi:MAG: C39 family peptidase, partial [Verrucomicrobiota bacterium]